jgi:hypothetical protein
LIDFSAEQQIIFDAGIADLRARAARRKALMNLPSLLERAEAIKTLRLAVARVKEAAQANALQTAATFSSETEHWLSEAQAIEQWLSEAEAVANDLLAMATKWTKAPADETAQQRAVRKLFKQGAARPNDYRTWLIGEEIPKLFELVFVGDKLRITEEPKTARGRRGVDFVTLVLVALDEVEASSHNVKRLIGLAKTAAKAGAGSNQGKN